MSVIAVRTEKLAFNREMMDFLFVCGLLHALRYALCCDRVHAAGCAANALQTCCRIGAGTPFP